MTTAEAARLAKMTVKGIQAAIHRGKLPAIKVGRDWHIKRTDLDAWLASPRRVGRPSVQDAEENLEREMLNS